MYVCIIANLLLAVAECRYRNVKNIIKQTKKQISKQKA